MNIAIYQINHKRDLNNVCFVRLESLNNFQDDEKIDSKIYDKVYEENFLGESLEDVYRKFNLDRPRDFQGRSLSVSDIVEVKISKTIEDGFYFCDSFGFQKVEFDKNLCHEFKKIKKEMEMDKMNLEKIREEYPVGSKIELFNMEGEPQMPCGLKGVVTKVDDIGQIHVKWDNGSGLALNLECDSFRKVDPVKEITVLYVSPGKYPKELKIDDTLEAMQELVGGYIEEYMPFDDDVAIVCNEEGKLDGLPLNRAIYSEDEQMLDIIAGDFFIAYAPEDSDSFGSLPRDLLNKYYEKFKFPERFFENGKEISAVKYKPSNKEMER